MLGCCLERCVPDTVLGTSTFKVGCSRSRTLLHAVQAINTAESYSTRRQDLRPSISISHCRLALGSIASCLL